MRSDCIVWCCTAAVLGVQATSYATSGVIPQILGWEPGGYITWRGDVGVTNSVLFRTNLALGDWETITNVVPIVRTNTASLPPPHPSAGFYCVLCSSSGSSAYFSAQYSLDLHDGQGQSGEHIQFGVYIPTNSSSYWLELRYAGEKWDNDVSSLNTYNNTQWTLYAGDDGSGARLEGEGSDSSLVDDDFNDVMNSFRAGDETRSWITFNVYEHKDYGGEVLPFKLWRTTNDNSGIVLEITDLANTRWNDKVRSISCERNAPSGAPTSKWYFYENSNYGGTNMVLTGDDYDDNLTDNGLDKKISSIKLVLE